MRMIDYLYYGLFLFALILMYFALKQFNITKDLLANGIITKATVTDLIKVSSDDGYTYKPVFEYTDNTNNIITFKSDVSSKPAPYAVGDLVDIVYSTENDRTKVVSYWGLYRWTIILLSIAAPFLIISAGYFLYLKG